MLGCRIHEVLFLLALICVSAGASLSASAAPGDFTEEELNAFAIVEDAKNAFVARAYDPLTPQDIYDRALDGLIDSLGARFEKHRKKLSAMGEVDAWAEYCDQLRQIASSGGLRKTIRELAEESIKGVCKSIDPYCSYVNAEQLSVYQRTRLSPKSGVGITIYAEDDGTLKGFPIKGSAADAAGIVAGEELVAVDGRPVRGESLETVANWIRGVLARRCNCR